jgi:hypothetical protein
VISFFFQVLLTGYQLFVYINRVQVTAGEAIITSSFPYYAPPSEMFGIGNPSLTEEDWSIYFYAANRQYEEYMIYCSPPHPPSSVQGMANMRYITKFQVATPGEFGVGTFLFPKFTIQPKVGDEMRVLIRTHNTYNGSFADQIHPNVTFVT